MQDKKHAYLIMAHSDKLFARKFSSNVDAQLIDEIAKAIK